MPAELAPLLLVMFLVALGAGGIELRNALRAPVCPRCVHCRHEALARQERDARTRDRDVPARWRDDWDERGRRPPR